MALPQYQIDEWFAAPRNQPGQDEAIRDILTASRILAETINKHIPDGDEKMAAMQHIVTAERTCESAIRWKWPAGKISLM